MLGVNGPAVHLPVRFVVEEPQGSLGLCQLETCLFQAKISE